MDTLENQNIFDVRFNFGCDLKVKILNREIVVRISINLQKEIDMKISFIA